MWKVYFKVAFYGSRCVGFQNEQTTNIRIVNPSIESKCICWLLWKQTVQIVSILYIFPFFSALTRILFLLSSQFIRGPCFVLLRLLLTRNSLSKTSFEWKNIFPFPRQTHTEYPFLRIYLHFSFFPYFLTYFIFRAFSLFFCMFKKISYSIRNRTMLQAMRCSESQTVSKFKSLVLIFSANTHCSIPLGNLIKRIFIVYVIQQQTTRR